MLDKNSRKIDYLRISVTDLCNLRCIYCRPEQGLDLFKRSEILDFEEICVVAQHGVKLGINKFRLTGGEPLARKGIESLVEQLADIEGVDEVAMTTNGILLKDFAQILKKAGLARINISLDTMRPDKFAEITRGGNLRDVFLGIEQAEKSGFTNLKLNVVTMAGVNDDEIEDFARLTLEKEIEVRFIELMATRNRKKLDHAGFLSTEDAIRKIKKIGNLVPAFAKKGNGPAKRFQLEGAKGTLGFINAVTNPFCGTCNRLRLTSDGKLRSCLLKGGEVDVKSIIRADYNDAQNNGPTMRRDKLLTDAFYKAANMKPSYHEGSDKVIMYQVGG